MRGKFAIDRDLLSHKLWLSEKFTDGQAWVDLIGLANWKDGFINVRGNKVELQRGDVGWSKASLAKRWKWSYNKVTRYFKFLSKMEMITIKQDNTISTVISINNYNSRQLMKEQTIEQTIEQTRSRRKTKNKDNKDNKYKTQENFLKDKKQKPRKTKHSNNPSHGDYYQNDPYFLDYLERAKKGELNEYQG